MTKQTGSLLLELSVVLLFLMAAVVWAGQSISRQVDDSMAEATAVWMLALKGSVDQLLSRHFLSYAEGKPILTSQQTPMFVNQYAPTIDELKKNGFLALNVPSKNPFGTGAKVVISRDSANCPGSGCRMDGLVYSDAPIKRPNSEFADLDLVSHVVSNLQGYGGASWLSDSQSLKGASFKIKNPLPDQVGVVGAFSGFDYARFHEFVRIGDTRDPSLQGQLSVQAELSAKRLGVREEAVPNALCSNSHFSGGVLNTSAQVELAKTSSGGLVVCVGGKWRAISAFAEEGQVCGTLAYPDGATATNSVGVALLCRNGRWIKLMDAQVNAKVATMGIYNAPQGDSGLTTLMSIPKPDCKGGKPYAYVVIQGNSSLYASEYKGFNINSSAKTAGWATGDIVIADDGGANWEVRTSSRSRGLVVANCIYQ